MIAKKFLLISFIFLIVSSFTSPTFSSVIDVKDEVSGNSEEPASQSKSTAIPLKSVDSDAAQEAGGLEDILAKVDLNADANLEPNEYFLERHVDGNLLAQYTNNVIITDLDHVNRTFRLDRQSSVDRQAAVTQLPGQGRNHLIAQGFCYNSGGISMRRVTTSLELPQIPNNPNKIIDWVSVGAAQDNVGYYSRVSDTFGGHSEGKFIQDFNALWIQNYTAVLKLLIPSSVFHGNENVYMTGIELFGSFDMCSAHRAGTNNRYNCIGDLVNFRQQHEQGQQSISTAVRNILRDRFRGGADSRGFVLVYNAGVPYVDRADYNAVDGAGQNYGMVWNGNQFDVIAPHQVHQNDVLSQHVNVNENPGVLYGHIHSLTGRNFLYANNSFQ